MKVKEIILTILITSLFSIFVFFFGMHEKVESAPVILYQVYLNGEKIGLIDSEEQLLDLIDREQSNIKKKYGVDKVYPPHGL